MEMQEKEKVPLYKSRIGTCPKRVTSEKESSVEMEKEIHSFLRFSHEGIHVVEATKKKWSFYKSILGMEFASEKESCLEMEKEDAMMF